MDEDMERAPSTERSEIPSSMAIIHQRGLTSRSCLRVIDCWIEIEEALSGTEERPKVERCNSTHRHCPKPSPKLKPNPRTRLELKKKTENLSLQTKLNECISLPVYSQPSLSELGT